MYRREQRGFGAFRCPHQDDTSAAELHQIIGGGEEDFQRHLANTWHLAFAAEPPKRDYRCPLAGKQPDTGHIDPTTGATEYHNASGGICFGLKYPTLQWRGEMLIFYIQN